MTKVDDDYENQVNDHDDYVNEQKRKSGNWEEELVESVFANIFLSLPFHSRPPTGHKLDCITFAHLCISIELHLQYTVPHLA